MYHHRRNIADLSCRKPMMDLTQYKVDGTDAVYYIPEFVTEDEEEYLIRKVKHSIIFRWTYRLTYRFDHC